MSEPLFGLQTKPAQHRYFFLSREQANGGPGANTFRDSKERAVAAADIYEVIAGLEFNNLGDPFIDEPRNFFLVPAAKSEVVRVAGMLRRLAAVFYVVVGAGDH